MLAQTETQRAFENAVRQWCEATLSRIVGDLESSRLLPYPTLARLGSDLGLSALLRATAEARIRALRAPPDSGRPRTDTAGAEAAGSVLGDSALGNDPLLVSILLKELSRVSPGFALTLISTLGCAMAVLARGRAELVESLAIPVLEFEKVGAWALTEPEAGSDAFGGMKTTAVVEGESVRVNGQKTFITNAPHADVFAVYARVQRGGEERIGGVVIERGTKGLDTGPPMTKMGMHDSPTGELFLSDCVVPASCLLDVSGAGAAKAGAAAEKGGGATLDVLNLERATMPAMCLGIIERCTEESIRYAKTRRQFGRTIGEFQGVAFKLARMGVALENARNLVREVANAQASGRLDPRLASIAKLYCAEQATAVALEAIQVHGGAGYMAELPLEKLMRDAKMLEIGGGTNEIQLQTIARRLLA